MKASAEMDRIKTLRAGAQAGSRFLGYDDQFLVILLNATKYEQDDRKANLLRTGA